MQVKNLAAIVLLACLVFAGGCGGSSSGSGGGGGGITGSGPLSPPMPVAVSGGQTSSGVNVAVATPTSSPTPNAESLGIGTSATNTGITINQGGSATVILFGPGLSGNMTVSISGPADITISNPQTIMSTTNTPGISFTAVVASNAALGARTVVLEDPKTDITTFAGGLEVVP